jgi:hypothetical protein
MSAFNINSLISKYKLDEDTLAKELFPDNKFPKVALARITSGVSFLDTYQLSILAKITNLKISDLFINEEWIREVSNEKIKFYKNEYRIELDLETNVSDIYYGDKLVAVETLILDKNIKLSAYLKLVNEIITNLI